MKRLKSYAALLLFLLSATGCFAAAAPADTIALKRVETTDRKQIKRIHALSFNLSADVPAENSAVRTGVDKWLCGMLAGSLDIQPAESFKDEAEMAEFFKKQYVNNGRRDVLALAKAAEDDTLQVRVNYSYDLTVRKAYETDKFVTFKAESYAYMGGAHGLQQQRYATFRKDNGAILSWDDIILPKRKPQFRAAVADALTGYFGVASFKDMKPRLLVDEKCSRATFPLPADAPGLLADGLHVQYADYEIAPHAAGIPAVTISYKQMKGFWTPLAVKLWR